MNTEPVCSTDPDDGVLSTSRPQDKLQSYCDSLNRQPSLPTSQSESIPDGAIEDLIPNLPHHLDTLGFRPLLPIVQRNVLAS